VPASSFDPAALILGDFADPPKADAPKADPAGEGAPPDDPPTAEIPKVDPAPSPWSTPGPPEPPVDEA